MLDERALARLRAVADLPDLDGTHYEVLRRLGSGGMGTVYLVRDHDLGRDVALKVLTVPDESGTLSSRLLAEARHLARLEHPNIVPVHDVGRLTDGRIYYTMKLVRGRRLDAWRREAPSRAAALRLFQRVCEAVAFAHASGVIHRDLKPENVMVGPFGEALVMDWGVAKLMKEAAPLQATPASPFRAARLPEAASAGPPPGPPADDPGPPPGDVEEETGLGRADGRPLTADGAVIGTPAYMAPEQARGQVERLDQRTDVYALGAILYFLLAGRPPFEGASPGETLRRVVGDRPEPLRQIDRTLPKALEALCARAMAAEPSDRYASAREMAEDVERFLDGQPVSAHRETIADKARRLLSRNREMVWLVLAYLIMRGVVLAVARR